MSDETYTFPCSIATYQEIANAVEASGMDGGLIFMTPEGHTVFGVELGNVQFYPAGGPDQRIHSGNLSDYEVGLGEEAFRAGFDAGFAHAAQLFSGDPSGAKPGKVDWAWDQYEPSDALRELQSSL